jgi:hypothetical protein
MNARCGLPVVLRCLGAALGMLALGAGAHTLPISYLHLVPDADYLHLELVFNAFELTFMSEVDENKDGELSPAELQAHGQMVADRVVAALKLSVGGRELHSETAGMDPDLSGHHVRLRAHYKVDARRVPLTVESDLNSITSASHLTQVTYANGTNTQKAQLDSQSRKVTFTPPSEKKPAPPLARETAAFGLLFLLLAVLALLIVGAGLLLFVRKRIE